jgi:hypothetical protein
MIIDIDDETARLRDQFATAILNGFASLPDCCLSWEQIADAAYRGADEMLSRRLLV